MGENGLVYIFRDLKSLGYVCRKARIQLFPDGDIGELLPRKPSKNYPTRKEGQTISMPVGWMDTDLHLYFNEPKGEVGEYHKKIRAAIEVVHGSTDTHGNDEVDFPSESSFS